MKKNYHKPEMGLHKSGTRVKALRMNDETAHIQSTIWRDFDETLTRFSIEYDKHRNGFIQSDYNIHCLTWLWRHPDVLGNTKLLATQDG